jgi:hypothetical protein
MDLTKKSNGRTLELGEMCLAFPEGATVMSKLVEIKVEPKLLSVILQISRSCTYHVCEIKKCED